MTLTAKAEASGLDDIAAIFSGHHTLLDDPELLAAASELLQHEHCTAEYARSKFLKNLASNTSNWMMNIYKLAILMWTIFCIAPGPPDPNEEELRSLTRQLFYWRRTFILPQYCNWIRRL